MENLSRKYTKIHCLGGGLVDLIVRPIKNYPQPKVNTSIFVDNFSYSVGGGAANVSQALAKLGLNAHIFTQVGDDPFGKIIEKSLNKNGVDTKNLQIFETGHTSMVLVGVHEDADRSFISYHGVLAEYSLDHALIDTLLDCSFLFYPDLFNLPRIDGKPLVALFQQAQDCGVQTLLDLTWGVSGLRRELLEEVLPFVDYFLPSVDECRLLYPDQSDEKILDYFLSRGANKVVLKRGSEGILASDGQNFFKEPSLKNTAEIVDTNGAGDHFNSGMLYGLVHGFSFHDCLHIGTLVASYSLMGSGSWYAAEEIQREVKHSFPEVKDEI